MNELWKKLKYFSMFILITVTKQSTNERYRMTTTTNYPTTELDLELGLGLGGLSRMTDADFEQEYSKTTTPMPTTGTPRPGMDNEDATARQDAAFKAIWTFSQAAKASAVKSKLRRSPHARTHYCMANRQVEVAFCELQQQIERTPTMMTQADFKLFKQAMYKYRVRFIVHDSKSIADLQEMQANIKAQEDAAEVATRTTFVDKEAATQAYLDAKDTYLDLHAWNAELTKEIRRCQPKPKYASMGGGLFRNMPATTEPPGVPSQHAQIAPASGNSLRNVLKPETIRRKFISFHALTGSIRNDVIEFLTDPQRHKDRTDVIKQIKESLITAAAAAKAKKLSQKPSN